MDPVKLIKNCIESEEYLNGVAGAIEFLDVKGQGQVELKKTVQRLQRDAFENEGNDDDS